MNNGRPTARGRRGGGVEADGRHSKPKRMTALESRNRLRKVVASTNPLKQQWSNTFVLPSLVCVRRQKGALQSGMKENVNRRRQTPARLATATAAHAHQAPHRTGETNSGWIRCWLESRYFLEVYYSSFGYHSHRRNIIIQDNVGNGSLGTVVTDSE